jgi:hypothetical protein
MTAIPMDTTIYGMAVRGRTVYYCAWDKGLRMLDLNDQSVRDIINSDMSYVDYVATSGDILYYTNVNTHAVTCCDLHGTTLWEFKDNRALHGPHGISADNDGIVYVVDHVSRNIVVISPDGQRHRKVLSSNNDLSNAGMLDYEKIYQ